MNFMTNLLRLSLTNPTEAGAHILALRLTPGAALSAFVVTIIVAVVLMFALSGFQPRAALPGFAPITPVTLVAVMGLGTLGLIGCIWLTARAFGGSGRFSDGVLVFAWIQILQVGLQIAQTALMVISVTLAGLISIFATGLLFWILFGLLNAWLQLGSMWKAALCFVIGVIGLSMGGAFILVSLGVGPQQVAL
jgi:hypothetical protein